jgi:endonuclease-3
MNLLIATVLSAQCTDKRVNEVTKVLFNKYDLDSLASAQEKDIEVIIRSLWIIYIKNSDYIINIANSLINDQKGVVPNDRRLY